MPDKIIMNPVVLIQALAMTSHAPFFPEDLLMKKFLLSVFTAPLTRSELNSDIFVPGSVFNTSLGTSEF